MKKLQHFLNCAAQVIRKKFSNSSKADICQECGGMTVIGSLIEQNKEIKEYLDNYTSTTRWQTL